MAIAETIEMKYPVAASIDLNEGEAIAMDFVGKSDEKHEVKLFFACQD
jgi:hypothetical protein